MPPEVVYPIPIFLSSQSRHIQQMIRRKNSLEPPVRGIKGMERLIAIPKETTKSKTPIARLPDDNLTLLLSFIPSSMRLRGTG
ncbi:uncharacterized protein N7498_005125 [Penicillium cinerascens]|uniref:Uncharacterized protein n=1 Tax=Penicillium cinerascens TaxID=70096 RepID=A0A9W9T037_9EURO|nr:uncharacterized protein N7498_005125 [Penicillium cinerascens]KAJ5204246.1 hypothetical protein N7498_005125 [Penicillium cinerascens]